MARQCQIDSTLPAENRRPDKQKESDKCGNRIAWKTEKEFMPRGSHLVSGRQTTENERATGFDRYFPELEISSKFRERLFHKIHFTHRNTAGSNHNIALFESAGQCEPGCLEHVRDERINSWNGSRFPDQSGDACPVAFIYLARGEG